MFYDAVSDTIRRRADIGAYLGKKGWIQGHILREITDLEFGTQGFLMNHVFLPTEQAETNIC